MAQPTMPRAKAVNVAANRTFLIFSLEDVIVAAYAITPGPRIVKRWRLLLPELPLERVERLSSPASRTDRVNRLYRISGRVPTPELRAVAINHPLARA